MSDIKTQASAVASRIDSQEVGIDPATITLILTTILPQLFSCLKDNDGVSSSSTQDRIKALNDKDRPRLIRRTALAVKKNHKAEQRKKPKRLRLPDLTDEQAEALAIAIIDQTIDGDPSEVSVACHECACVSAAQENED